MNCLRIESLAAVNSSGLALQGATVARDGQRDTGPTPPTAHVAASTDSVKSSRNGSMIVDPTEAAPPHMAVRRNAAYSLQLRRLGRAEIGVAPLSRSVPRMTSLCSFDRLQSARARFSISSSFT